MNITFGDTHTRGVTTNVGLITSHGQNGDNIMACEWTFFISYSPALITLAIRSHKATAENIRETGEFGAHIASIKQAELTSVVGHASGHDVDKIAMLRELGARFEKGKHIRALMLKDTCLRAECKLVKTVEIGDHPLLIGEVLSIQSTDAPPLLYHGQKYFSVGEPLDKPTDERRAYLKNLQATHRKSS